ncbi:hypothetical protein E2C01_036089 [Portunus trituberculatus]|uniref:Uncharacterized protein n=1 Tax=Portunus trituberculatus TaxID=210409 RepID=A0A5B7FAA0_PORTR|nr:hypothetical protein [Portunus trituberculatus]
MKEILEVPFLIFFEKTPSPFSTARYHPSRQFLNSPLCCHRDYMLSSADPHGECLSCREVFCSLASHCDCCKTLSHDQSLHLLESLKDHKERRKASSFGKHKSPKSGQLQKHAQDGGNGSPFSGFQTVASQVDGSKLGMSGAMQRLGRARTAVAAWACWHPPQAQQQQQVKQCSALGTFCTVYGGGVGNSHLALMPCGRPTTQDTEVGICHTVPKPGGQTPFQDVEAAIDHMASMHGGQLIIPSHGLGTGETIPLSLVVEFGRSHAAKMSGVGVCPLAPMPGGHPLPRSGLGNVEPGGSVPGGLPLIQEASVEAGKPALVPGGSVVGQSLLAPMPVGHPLSAAGTCEGDWEEVLPNQEGVSLFLHLTGQGQGHLPSPEAASSSELTDVERAQGSVLPCHPTLTFPQSLMVQAVHEEAKCRFLKEPKPCSANFQLSTDWVGRAMGALLAPPPVNELGVLWPVGNPAVSVSCLLAQMEKVCGSMADIASWMDQVLATLAGVASSMEQDVLEFYFSKSASAEVS